MTGYRPIDLARVAGISTQQIRNYADAGILPSVSRTTAGYRRFGDRHRRALLTYRALATGFGPHTAQAIMHAVHAGDTPRALALVDAGHATLHDQRLSLQATVEALEALAAPTTAGPTRSSLRVGQVAAHLGIRTSALRTWESTGLLTPAREPGTNYRRFTTADVHDAQVILLLRQNHYPLPQIRPVLDGLRRTGSSDALRAAIASRQASLTAQATAMLEAAGHLHAYLTKEAPSSDDTESGPLTAGH